MKITQKTFAMIIVAFCFLFLGDPIAIIITTIVYAYFNPLGKLNERIITSLTSNFDQLFTSSLSKNQNELNLYLGMVSKD